MEEEKQQGSRKRPLYLIIAVLAGLLLINTGYYLYEKYIVKPPEIVTTPSTAPQDLAPYFPKETKSTVKDISHQIERAVETKAPTYHYYTVTQEAADQQAQDYGKKEHVDKIVKTTREVELKDEKGASTGQKIYENDYYGINLERKHKIKVGAIHVDDANYASLTYQNRDIEYSIYGNQEGVKGVGVNVTIAKW